MPVGSIGSNGSAMYIRMISTSARSTRLSPLTSPRVRSPPFGAVIDESELYITTSSASARSTKPSLFTSPKIPVVATFARGTLSSAATTRSTGAMPVWTRKSGFT